MKEKDKPIRFDKPFPKKQIECDKCGYVTEIPKAWTLKECNCKNCGSLKIRLYDKKYWEKVNKK